MQNKILVTGATGNVGTQVVNYLLKDGREVIGAKLPHENPATEPGLSWIDFDFTDPDTWGASLDGVSRVFLMRPPHISKIDRDMAPFMRFMKDEGVELVVFMSVQGVEHNKMVPHYVVEQACIEYELPYVFIRPSFFMQNLTTTHLAEIRDERVVFTPTGRGKTNFIDVRDIGELAAKILSEEGHLNRKYTVTGEKSYSYAEIAEELSSGLDVSIRFVNPGPIRFIARNLRQGRKLAITLVMLFLYSIVKFGKGDITTGDTEAILGRRPRSLQDFIADHRTLLLGGAG